MRQFTDQLIDIAFRAFINRRTELLENPARLLMRLQTPYNAIGKHFLGLYLARSGDHLEALGLLEQAALDAPPAYQARSIGCMASIANSEGDLDSARVLAEEALKAATWSSGADDFARLAARQILAINKERRGDSRSALRDFLDMMPETAAASTVYEPLYLNLLNSIAVEFMAIGRIDEALDLSARTVQSPYRWREWQATWDELKARRTDLWRIPHDKSYSSRSSDDRAQAPTSALRLCKSDMARQPGTRREIVDLLAGETKRGKLEVIAGLLRQELTHQQNDAIIDLLDGLWFNTGTWT
ncbi:MAG TPA: hypothetical protein VEZ90_19000 [Blastocatellia bacterium]|nr:hypothetical protein [Blastocatellia bacterium]